METRGKTAEPQFGRGDAC